MRSPEKTAVRAKLADGNGGVLFEIEHLEALSRVLVPVVEISVGPNGSKRSVLVERDRVHRTNRHLGALRRRTFNSPTEKRQFNKHGDIH